MNAVQSFLVSLCVLGAVDLDAKMPSSAESPIKAKFFYNHKLLPMNPAKQIGLSLGYIHIKTIAS